MTTSARVGVPETRGEPPEVIAPPRRPQGRRRLRDLTVGYSFLAPNLLLLVAFLLVPIGWALWISLQRTDGFGSGIFAGLDNYVRLTTDPIFWRTVLNTGLFTLLVVPLSMFLGLGAAVLLNAALPGRSVFRTIIVLPMVISGVASALIGVLIFDQNNGVFNKLLRSMGLGEPAWQSNGAASMASVVLVTLWWRVGFNMLIYLAGLQSIDAELYEAARLDGANGWDRFRYLTVPMVGPSTFFLLVMNIIYSFQVFEVVFVLTGGGPGYATSVLVTFAYENAFVTRDQGYAAAIGVVLLFLTLSFTAVQWRLGRTRGEGGNER